MKTETVSLSSSCPSTPRPPGAFGVSECSQPKAAGVVLKPDQSEERNNNKSFATSGMDNTDALGSVATVGHYRNGRAFFTTVCVL